MRNFPIVDTHVHILMENGIPYQSLQGNYTLADYNASVTGLSVETILFMECDCKLSHYREEVAFASGLAHVDPRIKGIIASLPLEKGAVLKEEIAALTQNILVKGVRRLLKFEEETFCLSPAFIAGVQLLGKYGLSFEICTSLEQNRHLPALVSQCPDVMFMFDHIGTPDIRGKRFAEWKQGITDIAAFENVWCKLSSIATEAEKGTWTKVDIEPYISHCLSVFGSERLVFGSDWPVSLSNSSVERSVAVLDELLGTLSETEQKKIYHDNALSFYKI